MKLDPIQNFLSQRTGSVDSSQNKISVEDANAFPDPTRESGNQYNLVIWDPNSYDRPDRDPNVEIVRVYDWNRTYDNLFAYRGQEGTSASSHPADSEVILPVTERTLNEIESGVFENRRVTSMDGSEINSILISPSSENHRATFARTEPPDAEATGSVWYADNQANSIYKKTISYLGYFSGYGGSIITQFAAPSATAAGLAKDHRDGSLWHVDREGGGILYKLNQNGSVVTQLSAPGGAPHGLDLDEVEGSFWHADWYNNGEIYKFDQTGSTITKWSSPAGEVEGIAVNEKTKCLWHTDVGGYGSIFKLNQTGSVITKFTPPCSMPTGITIDERNGCIWQMDGPNGSIYRMDQEGNVDHSQDNPDYGGEGLTISDLFPRLVLDMMDGAGSTITRVPGRGNMNVSVPSNISFMDIEGQFGLEQFTVEWRERERE